MKIFLDNSLVEKAREVARGLITSGQDSAIVPGAETDRDPAQFRLQRNSDGLIVLGQFEEQGLVFFIGTSSS